MRVIESSQHHKQTDVIEVRHELFNGSICIPYCGFMFLYAIIMLTFIRSVVHTCYPMLCTYMRDLKSLLMQPQTAASVYLSLVSVVVASGDS